MKQLTPEFYESNLPKLGFGIMRLPMTVEGDNQKIDMPRTQELVDAYMAAGFNYFDTAYVYHGGASETAIRETIVKKYPRESFYLADKMPLWQIDSEEKLETTFQEQLDRCGVDYFDFYLLHCLDRNREKSAAEVKAFDFLARIKQEGRATFVGCSFHDTPDALEHILANHPELEFVQLQINYLDWNDTMRSDEYYRIARKYNKPIIIMEPVRGGVLAKLPEEAEALLKQARPGDSMAKWAFRFCYSLPGVITTLSGMSNMEQVQENLETFAHLEKLTETEQELLRKAVEIFKATNLVPCTACKYCVDCPAKVHIPDIFTVYNEYKRSGNLGFSQNRYRDIGAEHQAAQCVACGQCEGLCPQHINIIERLKVVQERLG